MDYEFTRQKLRTKRRQSLLRWTIAALAASAAIGLATMWPDSHTTFGMFRAAVLGTMTGAATLVITGAIDGWQR